MNDLKKPFLCAVPRRFLCLLLSFFLLLASGPSLSASASLPDIRVNLRRLNLTDRLDLTLSGRYLAVSSVAELLLPDAASLTVLARDQQLILFIGGLSLSMGKQFSLRRVNVSGAEPFICFNLQSGRYPGDLSLKLENGTIRLVLSLPLETYLQGVVPYEMDNSFPPEALKAQAVCARTYALSRMNASAAWDVTDTTDDQVFRGLLPEDSPSAQAVRDTAGIILTWQGKEITAWYSASNGGQTELPAHVWGGQAPGCFAIVEDPWDAENPESAVRVCALNRDGSGLPPAFLSLLWQACMADPELRDQTPPEGEFRILRLVSLELTDPRYAAPSRLMTRLRVTFEAAPLRSNASPVSAEEDLHIEDLLPAASFSVSLKLFPDVLLALGLSISGANNEIVTLSSSDSAFTLRSGRYGHGVGLSQRGAQQMARTVGKTFAEILAFYYPGAELMVLSADSASLPTPNPLLAMDPGPAPTATPRPTLMPVSEALPEGAWLASVEHIDDDSSLNLRSQPSAGAEILMRLYRHQQLIVLEESGVPGWVHVKTDAAEGYVMLSFLEKVHSKD